MPAAMLRELVADAARVALEEGVLLSSDPLTFLQDTSAELLQFAHLSHAMRGDGEPMRAIVAEEMLATVRALLARYGH